MFSSVDENEVEVVTDLFTAVESHAAFCEETNIFVIVVVVIIIEKIKERRIKLNKKKEQIFGLKK